MSTIIIFAFGYAVGGVSALLLTGLMLASRRGACQRPNLEIRSRDVEHYSY